MTVEIMHSKKWVPFLESKQEKLFSKKVGKIKITSESKNDANDS